MNTWSNLTQWNYNESLTFTFCLVSLIPALQLHISQKNVLTSFLAWNESEYMTQVYKNLHLFHGWTFSYFDKCVEDEGLTASIYLLFTGGSNEETLLVNTQKHLERISCDQRRWKPETGLIIFLQTNQPKQNPVSLVTSVFSLLWEKMVYKCAVTFMENNSYSGHFYMADPFSNVNLCGRSINKIYLGYNCTSLNIQKSIPPLAVYKRNNFKNCVLKVSARDYPPFSYQTTLKRKWKGTEVNILQIMEEKTEVDMVWINRPSVSETGSKTKVLEYYKDITLSHIDIAIGGSVIEPEYYSNVTYLQSHATQYLYFFVPDCTEISDWRILYMMFSKKLWLFIACTVFFCVIIMHIFKKKAQKEMKEDVFHSFLMILSILLEMPIRLPVQTSLRLFLAFLIFPLYSLSSSYLTQLHSLTINPTCPEIKTIQDLHDSDLYILTSEVANENILQTEDKDLQTLFENHHYKISHRGLREDMALLDRDRDFAVPGLHANLMYIVDRQGYNIHFVPYKFLNLNVALIVPKGSLYTERLNHFIQCSIEHGFYKKWELEFSRKTQIVRQKMKMGRRMSYRDVLRPLSLSDVAPAFLILLVGSIISFVIFLIELFIHRHRRVLDKNKSKV